MSAVHYICYRNLGVSGGITVPCIPRTHQHTLNAAEKEEDQEPFRRYPPLPLLLLHHHHKSQLLPKGYYGGSGCWTCMPCFLSLRIPASSSLWAGPQADYPPSHGYEHLILCCCWMPLFL